MWQLIPQLLGLWLHILSEACCLPPSSLHPPAAAWNPHGLWGDVGWGQGPGSPCVSRECSEDWQDRLRVSGCPCRVGGVQGSDSECENVSASVCLSPVWLWCGCLLLCLDLASHATLPPPPTSCERLLALSAHNWSLPCLFLEFGEEEEEEAGRQTSHILACPPCIRGKSNRCYGTKVSLHSPVPPTHIMESRGPGLIERPWVALYPAGAVMLPSYT